MTPPAGDIRRPHPPPHPAAPPAAPPAARPADGGGARRGGAPWRGLAEAAAAALVGRRPDRLSGLPEEQAARIRAAQIASVVRVTPLAAPASLLNASLVVLVFWNGGPRWLLAGWFAALALLAALALRNWWSGRRRPPRTAASRRATRRALAHAVAFAAVWGVAPAALFPAAGPFERFVLGSMATGMMAGGAFSLSAIPAAGLAYTWIMCLMTASGLVSSGDPMMLVSAAFLCLYASIVSRSLLAHGDLFAENLRVSAESEARREVLGLLLRDFEESAADCLWETDADGRLRRCSARLARMLGIGPGAGAGAALPGILLAGGAELAARFAGRAAFRDMPVTVPAPGGGERTLSLTAKPVFDAAGGFAGFRGVAADVTERVRAEADLLAERDRFDAALENMSQGLCMFDAAARLVVRNERFLKLFRLPPGEARPGMAHRELVERIAALGRYAAGVSVDAVCGRTRALAGRGAEPATEDRPLADGRTLAVTTRAMAGGGWVTTFEDVTERRRAEARIAHMARHDALTGLPNRSHFQERLERMLHPPGRRSAVAGGGPAGGGIAVLCLDLDRFKDVNDTLGHPAGDALLKAVTGRIASAIRARGGAGRGAGAAIARLGGDEFAVALPVAGEGPAARAQAAGFAARLVSALNEPFEIESHQVFAGASVGVALAPADGDRSDRLLKAADLALHRAKSEGRGGFRFFEPEMGRRAQARRAMETDLRRALAVGEFELHYQPLLDLRTDRVSGFEALLRWNHPGRGRVPPAEFVPVAEELGLITAIGDWVLRAACAEAATWPDGLKVAVNLSPAQFAGRKLVASVAEALSASRLPPSRLELEITETVLLERSEQNLEQLHQLRALGARIAMDDFGTGYSSLGYLRSFPFDKIKIDRSFVRDLEGDGEGGCAAIVRAVAGLGASLGVSTTAEGVETAAQLALVRAEGCTEVQGYHISPPRPAAELADLLRPSAGRGGAREVAAEAG